MNIAPSKFIENNKKRFESLLSRLLEEYSYASILVEDSIGKTYNISKNGINISLAERFTHRGYVVRVFDEKTKLYAEYSSNKIDDNSIDYVVEKIKDNLRSVPENSSARNYTIPDEDVYAVNESSECDIDPESVSDEKIINKIISINESMYKKNSCIFNAVTNYTYCKTHKLFWSEKKNLEQNIMWSAGYLAPYVKNDKASNYYFKGFSCQGGLELLDEMMGAIDEVTDVAKEMTHTYQIEPGEYDCVCSPETTGMIVHEAFGHGVEMDMFVKDRALAREYIGKQVASPLVTMRDGAKGIDEAASYFFDDEGNLAQNTVIIDKGILKTGINDALTSDELKINPTGNGRRESYEHKAYTRMTNTYFEPGNDKVEDMIASIKYGFLLECPSCGMEDPKNWGIQCMVNIAREIKDGKLTGKIFSPVVLSGYVPDLLKSISMMSDTIYTCGSGLCGKGYKEWVKVSDGGPYIKARVKLG